MAYAMCLRQHPGAAEDHESSNERRHIRNLPDGTSPSDQRPSRRLSSGATRGLATL